jgi:hypothetical protein
MQFDFQFPGVPAGSFDLMRKMLREIRPDKRITVEQH